LSITELKEDICNFYWRIKICWRYGHLWVLKSSDMPDCERIYTSGELDKYYLCLTCKKKVDELSMRLVKK